MSRCQLAPACLLFVAALLAPAAGAHLEAAPLPLDAPDGSAVLARPSVSADPLAPLGVGAPSQVVPVARPQGALAAPVPVGPAGVVPEEGEGRPLHAPVVVVGDAAFRLPGSGVVRGSGTAVDPYVIEGWRFRAVDGRGPAIVLADTSAHVVVRDNVVEAVSEATSPTEAEQGGRHDGWPLRNLVGSELAGASMVVWNASNVRIEENRFTSLHLECESCVVEGNEFTHALASRLVGSEVRGNTLATLHVREGHGNVVAENVVPAWDRWAYPFHFAGGSLERFEANVVRGIWQQGVIVECAPGDEVTLARNDVGLENPITHWAVRASGCARVVAEDNRFSRGAFALEDAGELVAEGNRFDNNSVYLTNVNRVEWARSDLHSGTLLVRGGGEIAFRHSGFRGFTPPGWVHRVDVDDAASVVIEAVAFEDIQHGLEDTSATVRDTQFHRGYVLAEDGADVTVANVTFNGLHGVLARGAGHITLTDLTVHDVDTAVHLKDAQAAELRNLHVDGAATGIAAGGVGLLKVAATQVLGAADALVLAQVAESRLRDVTVAGGRAGVAVFAEQAAQLPLEVSNVRVDGRQVVRLEDCSEQEAAARAASAAYLLLIDCEGLHLEGAHPHLRGVAAARTPVTLRNTTLHPDTITAVSAAEVPPLRISGGHLEARGFAVVAYGAGPLVLEETRVSGPGVLGIGATVAVADSMLEGGGVIAAAAPRVEVVDTMVQDAAFGIVALGADAARIESNAIRGCGAGVVLLGGIPRAEVTGNSLAGCRIGVLTDGGAEIRRNLLVSGSDRTGAGVWALDAPATPVLVEGNAVVGFGEGIRIEGTGFDGIRHGVRENRVAEAALAGLRLEGSVADVTRNRFERNVIGVVATCPGDAPGRCPSLVSRNAIRENDLGLRFHTASPTLEENAIEGNGGGLLAIHPATRAPPACRGEANWWGHRDGPRAGDGIECRALTHLGQAPATPPPDGWLREAPSGLLAPASGLRLEAPPEEGVGEPVAFRAEGAELVAPGDGAVLPVAGDGAAEHAYTEPGAYTAWALGWDADGHPAWDRAAVRVT